MRTAKRLRAYQNFSAQQQTNERSPEELIVLLLDKACYCVRRSAMLPVSTLQDIPFTERLALIEEFHKSTSKALQIVVALREILDMESGGELAAQLEATYTAISAALWEASKNKDVVGLKKILEALNEIRSGWETIADT